jgi:hypothetical protein
MSTFALDCPLIESLVLFAEAGLLNKVSSGLDALLGVTNLSPALLKI